MSEIVFITPNFTNTVRSVPIGSMLLATILQNAGYSPSILHIELPVEPLEAFLDREEQRIVSEGAKIVTFYTRCDVYHLEIKLAQRLKERHPEIYIVFGGPQSDLCAEPTLREIPWVDYICRGEGETIIVPFFRSLLSGQPDESLNGLAFVRDGRIVMNPRPPLVQDLDALPTINYDLLRFEDKLDEEGNTLRYYSIDVGRGCPFGCTYCSTKSFWQQRYRLKSAERIISEMKQLHERFVEKYGTSVCRELLEKNGVSVSNVPSERTPEYYKKRHCAQYVAFCAGLIAEELEKK